MTANRRATRKTDNLADRTVGMLGHGDGAGSSIATLSDARPSPAQRSDAPTPFYDLLTSMIEAHASEKARNAANDDVMVPARKARGRGSRSDVSDARDATPDLHPVQFDTIPLVADHGWRLLTRRLNVGIAGMILTAAIGGVVLVSQLGGRQPLVVATSHDASKGRAPVIGDAGPTNEPVRRPSQAQTGEPGGLGAVGVQQAPPLEDATRTDSKAAAQPDDRIVIPPAAAQPNENLASEAETSRQAEDAPAVRSSSEVGNSDTIAPVASTPSDALQPQAQAPPPPPASKTGSTVERTSDTVAKRLARAIIQVNMRAGPSNDKAVVSRIPEGGALEVVKCQQWCEVIFAGQRGWVYKGFVGLSPVPRRP